MIAVEKLVWYSVSKRRAHVMSHRATQVRRQKERKPMGKGLVSERVSRLKIGHLGGWDVSTCLVPDL